MKPRIAIIGAGISGLTIANQLKDVAEIILFEKARGVSGRMSTRYADLFYFDHGTQCFTARGSDFKDFLKPFANEAIIAEWSGKVINLEIGKKTTKRLWFEPHLVASPNMNSLCKKMATGIDIRVATEVAPIKNKNSDIWTLEDKDGNQLGEFDWIISTAPPAQTTKLFETVLAEDSPIHKANMKGCFALMIGFSKPWDKSWIAAKVRNNPLKWISINSTKPGRNKDVASIVAHSRNDWAEKHMDDDIEEVKKFLLEQFDSVTGIATAKANYISIHRWKYAIVEETEKSGPYFDAKNKIGCVGDWSGTSRIEECWLAATQLATEIEKNI